MRSILLLVLVVVIGGGAIGVQRGWFQFGGENKDKGGKQEIGVKVDVNKDKIKKDMTDLKDAGKKVVDDAKKVTSDTIDKIKGDKKSGEPNKSDEPKTDGDTNEK